MVTVGTGESVGCEVGVGLVSGDLPPQDARNRTAITAVLRRIKLDLL
jgi:hypothetical protein